MIRIVAGIGQPLEEPISNDDGGPADAALVLSPTGLAVDVNGNIYVTDGHGKSVRKLTPVPAFRPAVARIVNVASLLGDGAPAALLRLEGTDLGPETRAGRARQCRSPEAIVFRVPPGCSLSLPPESTSSSRRTRRPASRAFPLASPERRRNPSSSLSPTRLPGCSVRTRAALASPRPRSCALRQTGPRPGNWLSRTIQGQAPTGPFLWAWEVPGSGRS